MARFARIVRPGAIRFRALKVATECVAGEAAYSGDSFTEVSRRVARAEFKAAR